MRYKINITDFGITSKFIQYEEITKDGSLIQHELSAATLQSILSYILYKYVYNNIESEWVEIYGYKFNSICKKYKPYLSYLHKNNIILIDFNYTVADKEKGISGESRKYCFTTEFKKRCKILNVKPDNTDFNYEDLYNCLNKKIKSHIESDYQELIVFNKEVEKEVYKEDNDGIKIYNFKKYIRNITSLKSLENKDKSFFKWKDDCRLYNPFVSLSEDVKLNNCSFGKNKLNHFDIKSSFPLFLSIWCVNNGIDKNLYEMKEFITGLKKGTFYGRLAYKLNNVKDSFPSKDSSTEENRFAKKPYYKKEAKIEFATWLNGNNTKKNGEVRTDNINHVMSRYFEPINEIVLLNKKEKNTFYYILSKMESNFIFNIVCTRLYKEIPKIKIVTCHDSIYFEDEFTNQVEKIWNEELNKLYDQIYVEDEEDIELLDPELAGLDINMKKEVVEEDWF